MSAIELLTVILITSAVVAAPVWFLVRLALHASDRKAWRMPPRS